MEIIPNWHPLLVHFTVALIIISALLFAMGYFGAKNKWQEKIVGAAYLNLWLGALITVLTVAAGIYAYNTVGHDTPSHLAMTDHRNWALVTAVVLWILAIWSAINYRAGKAVGLLFIVAMLVGAGLVGITGFKGGEVVYRYGLGVMSLPEAGPEGGADGHNHSHGAADESGTPKAHNDSGMDAHSHDASVKNDSHDH